MRTNAIETMAGILYYCILYKCFAVYEPHHSHNMFVFLTGSKQTSFGEAMRDGPLSPIVALIAFFSIWSVAGLGGFHTYLVGLNITTNEDVSKNNFSLTRVSASIHSTSSRRSSNSCLTPVIILRACGNKLATRGKNNTFHDSTAIRSSAEIGLLSPFDSAFPRINP